VTVQIGGNDLGFGDILTGCYITDLLCDSPLIQPADLQAAQARLTALYRQLLARIRSDGTLVVLNYPAILPNGFTELPCSDLDAFELSELQAIDAAWRAADTMILDAARAVGDARVRVIDLYHAFDGHKICSGTRDYADAFVGLHDSFHPNIPGHAAIAGQIRGPLGIV
jgi:lysophospholipase L1-like esterase